MKIYLLSRNAGLYSSKRIIEAARYRGHTIMSIDYMETSLVLQKGKSKIIYNGADLPLPDAIIPRIGASHTFYGSAVVRQFQMLNVFSAVDSDALLRSRDKFKCLQLLNLHGVDMPITAFSNSNRDADNLIKAVNGAPLVIKLLEGTQGLGVLLQETKKGAESVLEAFSQLDARVTVQEFIKESSGTDIRAIVVDGRVVAAMRRTAPEGEFRSNIHRGGTGMPIKLSADEEETAIKSAEALGLGVAGVDMLVSSDGPKVIEVNSSPGIEGIEGCTKLDIAKEIILYLEKQVKE
ncbi:MAG: 30S ribosomal protein S6--L-glutamate ligase [Flavobacteriales bacterium]|nr:30S ribosomal protein S6--L-glutamate ligase [Flavobacteriales bacterium]